MKNLLMCFTCIAFVASAQVPTASFALSQTVVCTGGTIQVTDLSTNSPTSFTYYLNGISVSNVQNPVITFTADGVHTIGLDAENSSGVGPYYWTQVVVNPLPVVSTGSAGAVTIPIPNGSTNGWAPMVHTFSDPLPNGAVVTGITLTYTGVDQGWGGSGFAAQFFVSGKYIGNTVLLHNAQNFTLTISAPFPNYAYGAANNFEMYFAGYPGWQGFFNNGHLTIHYHTNKPPASYCSGTPVTLTGIGASTYTWSPAAPNGAAFVPVSSAIFTVTGTNTAGCVNSMTQQVTLLADPAISVKSGEICPGESYVIVPSGASGYSITGGSFTVSPQITTSYSVTGTHTSNGCASSTPAVVNVSVVPLPTVSASSGTACVGSTFTIQVAGANTYSIEGGSAVKTVTATATYTVMGFNLLGCPAQAFAVSGITAVPLPLISAPGGTVCSGSSFTIQPTGATGYTFSSGSPVVTPANTTTYQVSGTANGCINQTGVQVFVDPCTGIITERYSGQVLLYPNPASAMFSIRASGMNSFAIIDINGKVVTEGVLENGLADVETSQIPEGIYLVVVRGSGSGALTKNLAVQK